MNPVDDADSDIPACTAHQDLVISLNLECATIKILRVQSWKAASTSAPPLSVAAGSPPATVGAEVGHID